MVLDGDAVLDGDMVIAPSRMRVNAVSAVTQ